MAEQHTLTDEERQRIRRLRRIAYRRRHAVFKRDGRKCVYCGAEPRKLIVEHRTPICRDGDSSLDNLSAACRKCDEVKGDMTAEEFLAMPRAPCASLAGRKKGLRP